MVKRARFGAKARSKSSSVRLSPARLALFGEPQLLEGEDAAAYEELLARVRAAENPVDVIDEMFVCDVVALEWEVLRWRRLKTSRIRARGLWALQTFLSFKLEYEFYKDRFADRLMAILQNLPEYQVGDFAQRVVHEYLENKPEAVAKINKILHDSGLELNSILNEAQADTAKALVQDFVRREPAAVTLVNELVAGSATSMDIITSNELVRDLEFIERIDHLTAIAENRRNAALREIDRRRPVLGETLRRTVQEAEDADFEVIETSPTKRKRLLESSK